MSEPVTIVQLAFFAFAALTLGSALMVVLSKNLLHSALFLVLTFFSVAGLYVLLEAEFLAAIQVLIYVGAVAVLYLFALMLTRGVTGEGVRQSNSQVLPAAARGRCSSWASWSPAALGGQLAAQLAAAGAGRHPMLGQSLMTTYALPFEVMGVVLLVALVGAIILAREN